MPPTRRSRSPAYTPFDPFLPLRRSSSSTNTPSYASVARSARDLADARQAARWGTDDVDRRETLDDLWASSRPDQTGFDAVAGDGLHASTSATGQDTDAATGIPAADDTDPTSRNGIFTLEELLGIARQPERAERAADPVLPREERTAYLPPWHGGFEAARRRGYAGPAETGTTSTQRHYEWLSYPSRRATARTAGAASGSGAAAGASEARGAGGEDESAAPRMGITTLRRRWREGSHRQAYVFDVDDIAPPESGDDPFWSRLGDHESDEEDSAGWGVGGLYNHPNDALEDDDDEEELEEQTSAGQTMRAAGLAGASSRGAELHRGGFNRRRLRMTASSRSLRDLAARQDVGATQAERFGHIAPARPRPTPTNLGVALKPTIVRSSTAGTRRRRRSSSASSDLQQAKRRRVAEPPLTLPPYLVHAGLPLFAYPLELITPPPRSHLSVTTARRPIVTFTSRLRPTGTDDDASAIRTSTPVPAVGVYYFEVEVLSAGDKGYISVGYMKGNVALNRLVGWEKGSWGWHADDGRSFGGQSRGEAFSEQWGTGDIVGAGIDYTTGRAFFTKNGKLMGHCWSSMPSGLHPAVGLRNLNESLSINLAGPFVFDIDGYVQQARDVALRVLRDTRVTSVPLLTGAVTRPAGTPISTSTTAPIDIEGPSDQSAPESVVQTVARPSALSTALGVPAGSSLRSPAERTEAAFVLDYLLAKGFRASASLKTAMAARCWISPSALKRQDGPTEAASTDTAIDPDLLDPASALARVRSLCQPPHAPTPWAELDRIDPARSSTSGDHATLGQRLAIYDYVRLLRSTAERARHTDGSTDPNEETDYDVIDKAVLLAGQALLRREKEEAWAKQEGSLLKEAMGVLSRGDVSGWPDFEAQRKADVELLIDNVRVAMGFAPKTHLEHAAAQTRLVLWALAERGEGVAAIVKVADCLKVPRRPQLEKAD